jgi:hypothetical protein
MIGNRFLVRGGEGKSVKVEEEGGSGKKDRQSRQGLCLTAFISMSADQRPSFSGQHYFVLNFKRRKRSKDDRPSVNGTNKNAHKFVLVVRKIFIENWQRNWGQRKCLKWDRSGAELWQAKGECERQTGSTFTCNKTVTLERQRGEN